MWRAAVQRRAVGGCSGVEIRLDPIDDNIGSNPLQVRAEEFAQVIGESR